MPKVTLWNMAGEAIGEVELSDEVFAAPVNEPLMHQAVVMYLANQRQGTHATKTRGLVRGGGRKPWRQKGTGRARQGSRRAPHWTGGATVFGPQPRDYRQSMPRQARRRALRSALSAKLAAGQLQVLDRLELAAPKTREVAGLLRRFGAPAKAMLVTAEHDPIVYRSARNIPGVATRSAADLNVYEVLNQGKLLLTRDAVARVEEVLG